MAIIAPLPARAHVPVPTRSLRLQLRHGQLEGLLVYRLPAAAAAVYSAAPDPAVAVAPLALLGLRLGAAGSELQVKVREARVRALPGGALEAMVLLDAGEAKTPLAVGVEAGPPLPIELLAESGIRLRLEGGPGSAIRGGLLLRPRPGLPCTVSINAVAARGTRR